CRFFHHRARILLNTLAVKRRLRDLPLSAMLRAFACNHAFAEQHFAALHRAFFYEVVVLDYQNFADIVRMVQKDDVVPTAFVVCDVSIVIDEVLKESNRIGWAKSAEGKPEKIALKARRKTVRSAAFAVLASFGPSGRCRHSNSLRCSDPQERGKTGKTGSWF